MQAAGLQRAVALDILPEGKERLVAEGEERPVQGGKDSQLVAGPFDRGEGIVESDDLLAIVEGAPTHENVGDAARFQRSDVSPCDISPEIAEPAKQNGDVPRPYSDGVTFLFDHPAALVQQPGDEGAYSVRKRLIDPPIDDAAIIPIRSGNRQGDNRRLAGDLGS